MVTDSPFFLTNVECPICKTVNEFETVRMGAYIEEGRDTDFCPQDIKWRFPKYQSYNPLVFFVATCSNCFYSREFTSSFKDWKRDNNFRMYRLKVVKEKHLDQLATADSVIKRLGEAIDISRYPNESALLKLHLAVFDELLCDHYNKLDLGRFYLRIGWVFRGLEKSDNPHVIRMRGLIMDMESKHHNLVSTISHTQDTAKEFSEYVKDHFETLEQSGDLSPDRVPFREQMETTANEIATLQGQVSEKLDTLEHQLQEYKLASLGGNENESGSRFGQYSSIQEFLLELQQAWDGIVTNEREALEKAAYYYKAAYVEGRNIAPGNQQIQASYLIAELSRRVGDYETAREYFNSTIKNGQEFIYRNRNDKTRTALARKILELAIEQGKSNMAELKAV